MLTDVPALEVTAVHVFMVTKVRSKAFGDR